MVPAIFLMLFEILALGKRITKSNIGFIRNDFAIFSIGFAVYLAITFAVFTPFIFIDKFYNFSDLYFVIIFAIKEVLLIFIIFSNNELLAMIKSYDIISFAYMTLAGVLVMITYNYGSSKLYDAHYFDLTLDEAFFSNNWRAFKTSVSMITTAANFDIVLNWGFSIVVGMYMYSTLASFLRKYMHLNRFSEFMVSFGLSMAMLFIMHQDRSLADMTGTITALYAIFISLNLIEHSRRRFGVLYTVTFIVAWTVDYQLLFAMSALSFSVLTLYLVYKKPMVPLFAIQLLSPLVFSVTILLTRYWAGIPLILNALLMPLYSLIVSNSRNSFLDKIHDATIKNYKYILGFIGLIVTTFFIVSVSTEDVNWKYAFVDSVAITSNTLGGTIASVVGYYIIFILLILMSIYLYISKTKFVKIRLASTLLLTLIIIFYNPFSYIAFSKIDIIKDEFTMLQQLVYIPATLIIISGSINLLFNVTSNKSSRFSKFNLNKFKLKKAQKQ